jgi:hypothetical protein
MKLRTGGLEPYDPDGQGHMFCDARNIGQIY